MKYSVFWVVTQRKAVWYRRFGIIYRSLLQGSSSPRPLKVGTIRSLETSASNHLTLRNNSEDGRLRDVVYIKTLSGFHIAWKRNTEPRNHCRCSTQHVHLKFKRTNCKSFKYQYTQDNVTTENIFQKLTLSNILRSDIAGGLLM
jgi:hypothetical protein